MENFQFNKPEGGVNEIKEQQEKKLVDLAQFFETSDKRSIGGKIFNDNFSLIARQYHDLLEYNQSSEGFINELNGVVNYLEDAQKLMNDVVVKEKEHQQSSERRFVFDDSYYFHELSEVEIGLGRIMLVNMADKYNEKCQNPEDQFEIKFPTNRSGNEKESYNYGMEFRKEMARFIKQAKPALESSGLNGKTLDEAAKIENDSVYMGISFNSDPNFTNRVKRDLPQFASTVNSLSGELSDKDTEVQLSIPVWLRNQKFFRE